MHQILILYYSRHGATRQLARHIAQGVETIAMCEGRLRTVPDLHQSSTNGIPEHGDLYATLDDLEQCDGLILGSPTRFGNMAGALQHFFEGTSAQWLNGSLNSKPAAVFTSSASMHGGQESTLLSMMLPLLHHGMLLVGVPFAGTRLSDTTTGGTPYGASHVSGAQHENVLSHDEKAFALELGKRVARASVALKGHVNS